MGRRRLLAVAALLAMLPGVLHAQNRIPTVALLWIEANKPSPYLVPLTQGLQDYGYARGRNIRLDERFMVKGYEELPASARRLVAEKPDVILVFGATAALELKKATGTIPVVIASTGDPVKLGLVKSLAKPDTNFTGLTALVFDLSAKRLELLREAAPAMRRVAIVLYPQSAAEVVSLKNFENAAREMGLETRIVEIRSGDEITPGLATLGKLEVHGIAFVGSSLFRAHAARIVGEVAKTRLPAVYTDEQFAHLGGLLSYGATIADSFRASAAYIDKILKGAKPADLPIEQPTRLRLTVNMKTANAQGIEIPRAVLLRADRVIE